MLKSILFLNQFAAPCQDGGAFFGFPTWYKYLSCNTDGNPQIENLTDFWLIAAAGVEMIIYVAGVLAVLMFIYGGFVMMTSQGSPDRVATGRKVLLNAAVGLVIAIFSALLVNLVARAFTPQ